MGIVFRQSVKTSIVTFTGAILGAMITFLQPYALDIPHVGLITNIIFVGAIVQYFVLMGMSNTIAIQTQKYEVYDERRKALFTLGTSITLIATILFSVFYLLLKDHILKLYSSEDRALLEQYYYLVPVLVFLWSFMSILDHYLIAHVKIAVSAFAREVILRLCNLLLIGLLFIKVLTVDQYIYLAVFIYAIPLVILFIVASRIHGFGFTVNIRAFNKKEYRGIFHFAWYHLLMVVSINIINYIDTLILGVYDDTGMEAIGIYSRAVMIAAIIYLPFRAMATSSLPILNEAYIAKDMPKVRDLFSRAGVNILVAGIGMFVIMAMNLDNAVRILPEGYEDVKPLVLILMIGKLIDMATGLNNELISISKYYKFNFRAAAFLLVMVIVLDRIYVPIYGMYAAAWVATVSLAAFNIMKLVFLYIKMKLHPFTAKTGLIIIAGIVAAIPGFIIPYIYNPFIDTILRSIVIAVVYVMMLLWLKPSNDLSQYLKQIRKQKRLF